MSPYPISCFMCKVLVCRIAFIVHSNVFFHDIVLKMEEELVVHRISCHNMLGSGDFFSTDLALKVKKINKVKKK